MASIPIDLDEWPFCYLTSSLRHSAFLNREGSICEVEILRYSSRTEVQPGRHFILSLHWLSFTLMNRMRDNNWVTKAAAFLGMHVSPAKQLCVTTKKVWLSERRTDGETDRRRTKWSLCAAMLRRRHKKSRSNMTKVEISLYYINKNSHMKLQVNILKVNKIKILGKGNNSFKSSLNTTKVKLYLYYVNINSYTKFQVDVIKTEMFGKPCWRTPSGQTDGQTDGEKTNCPRFHR